MGLVVKEKYIDSVLEVKRVSEILVSRLTEEDLLNVTSACK